MQAQGQQHNADINASWALWPEPQNQAAVLDQVPEVENEVVINLNQPGEHVEDDLMEVIVNPVHPHGQEAFLEINDLIFPQNEGFAIPAQNQQQQVGILNLLAAENNLLILADQEMQNILGAHADGGQQF